MAAARTRTGDWGKGNRGETHGSLAHYRTGNDHDDFECPGIEGPLFFSRDRALSDP